MTKLLCSVLVNLLVLVSLSSQNSDGSEHPNLFISKGRTKRDMPNFSFIPPKLETDPDFWNGKAQNTLKQRLSINRLNKNVAKNVIFFLGDGMGLATLMATRMYKGGEEKELSFERFPYTGLSKTYCTNVQVADSACSATSFLCGVKANYGTIGVSAAVLQGDCMGQNNTSNHVDSIIKFAQDNGMRTGIITNTRITHATPAGTYAHIANRDWENDVMVKKGGGSTETCPDIAYQLIHGLVGKRLNIVLGGGRQEFMMETEKDIDGNYGKRTDKNLLKHWKHIHRKENHRYVETLDDLKSVDNNVERLLGIFDSSHMPFYLDDGAKQKPTLSEMVDKALDIFESANDNKGYFLFVEGGKIDLGHHYGLAKKALQETVELEKAVELARLRTSEENTLVVVSSDHSHAFTVSGYSVSSLTSFTHLGLDLMRPPILESRK